ncbi:MAG TPA: DedA family protein [Syntrophaceticus sp.]|jgi:membrane protein DedA with SNARE-associated domain|uniref:SNARE associated Golgi protein-like protein n=1 Tax=Syntrophaceticus schinkii TaxID=499207 RepID=A0A0B7MEU7_9FIRM|nr:DedA family protein [Syntrophaceticus schinkii]CEO88605.1 SNARE associated Golgi protein-like protein [Syntrophaceticus schinkii]HHY30109.1 DedA family protein [Syntrophaceticus sp.]
MTEFLTELVITVTSYIASLGYWGVGMMMAIESCNIPLPSEIILPFGGYLVSTGQLKFFPAALAGATGGTVGSIISYFIGLFGGRPLLLRYGKYIGLTTERLHKAEGWLVRYGDATVFFSRLLPGIRTFISLPVGAARVRMIPFIIYTFLGSLIWALLLTYCGFLLGENWEIIRTWFQRIDLVLLGVIILLIAWFVWRKVSRSRA